MGLSSGQLLAQRYRLSRCIAIGGMGEVWQAVDTRLDRQVAVKVLKPELSDAAEFRRRFHTEARITASLNHPGIAAVHDYGEVSNPDVSYLVMELVIGDPLATILMRQPRLSVERTLDILGQAGDALQAAHERGLVHRDIKPGNILITLSGKVKLTDFGIARAVDAAPVTHSGMVIGTAHYIAPEQAAGEQAGPAGDVYSLGVVGYECLAGRCPFAADNAVTVALMHIRDRPPPLPRDVPPAVRALIEAAMVKDPRQRYRTGGEFAAAVAAVRAGHRLPLPGGVAGGAATAALSRRPSGAPRGTRAGAPSGILGNRLPPTAMLPRPPPQRYPERRGALRFALALLGVLVLVFGGYLAREALRSPPAPSGALSGAGTTDIVAAPAPPVTPQPFQPEPTQAQPSPAPDNRDEEPPEVLINPTDYWGHRGSDAATAAKGHGLIPQVVDEDGELIDPDVWSQCRIIGVDPPHGFIPRGSTLELTCRERSE
ncbi:MAG: serine/threonine protein kinase [Pseudonocardiales bacterium]|nr:serine/threonine protein kinase [Pseudonocardiales bacterium]